MGLSPSFAQLGIAPQHENGEAIVVNKCGVPVYYVSMGDSGSFRTLSPDGVYREQFRLRYLGADYPGEDKYGGISIMLSPNQTITAAVDKQQAFFQSTITQFEYTYHPLKPPGLWYDISNVNGYVYNTDNGWNGIRPWPFQEDGLIAEGTSEECATVVCPGGNPDGNSTCIQAYFEEGRAASFGKLLDRYENRSFIPADGLVFLYASKRCSSSFDHGLCLLVLERSASLESCTRKQAQMK
jgi:hypothetical protein